MAKLSGLDRIAGCSVTGATGAAVVADACATARTALGTYTVTLDTAIDATESLVSTSVRAAGAGAFIDVTHTSDTVLTVTTYNAAGAAADINFDLCVFRIR